MSALPLPHDDLDDAQATLDEALAFIDAWDASADEYAHVDEYLRSSSATESSSYRSASSPESSPPSFAASSSSSPRSSSESASSSFLASGVHTERLSNSLAFRIRLPPVQCTSEVAAESAAQQKKVKKNRAQTKHAIAALHDQVAGLEATLLVLQQRSAEPSGLNGSPKAVAATEIEKVQRSLKRNRELKDALATQLQISRALRKLVQSKRVQHGLAIALQEPVERAVPRSLQSYAEDPTLVFAELYSNAKSMHVEASAISEHICSSCGVSGVHLSSGITATPAGSASACMKLEISTNTPIVHNFRQLGRLFWSQMATPNDCLDTGHFFTHAQSTAPGVYEKCYSMSLPSPRGELHFRGVTVMRIFEDEARRVVITYASLFAETSSSTVFRENSWFILTDLASASSSSRLASSWSSVPQTLMQTFYCLTTDLKTAASPHVQAMQHFVLKSMSVTMRSQQQQMQNMVLADAETAPLLQLGSPSCLSVKCLT